MIFEKDGIRYKIMRNFGQGQTEYRIFDADTMEELKGKEYLFESDKQAFENTVSMTQAEIRTGREMKKFCKIPWRICEAARMPRSTFEKRSII